MWWQYCLFLLSSLIFLLFLHVHRHGSPKSRLPSTPLSLIKNKHILLFYVVAALPLQPLSFSFPPAPSCPQTKFSSSAQSRLPSARLSPIKIKYDLLFYVVAALPLQPLFFSFPPAPSCPQSSPVLPNLVCLQPDYLPLKLSKTYSFMWWQHCLFFLPLFLFLLLLYIY